MPIENRQASDAIEITPEMIEAGLDALFCFNMLEPSTAELREALVEVYRVMALTYTKGEIAH